MPKYSATLVRFKEEEGIEAILNDWWLADTEFFINLEAFEEWRDVQEESIVWDYVDYFEAWHDDDTKDGLISETCRDP